MPSFPNNKKYTKGSRIKPYQGVCILMAMVSIPKVPEIALQVRRLAEFGSLTKGPWDIWSMPKVSWHFPPIQNFHDYICAVLCFSSVQSLSRVLLFVTPWITARQASLSITNSRSSLRLTSIESVMPSSHLTLCHLLLLLPPIPPSIRVFSNESTLRMRWPKYWSFSFSISLPNEHPGLTSFRMDWLDLLAVQGTLESSPALQFKCINSSMLSFLHSPTLTFIHDHWKNQSLD